MEPIETEKKPTRRKSAAKPEQTAPAVDVNEQSALSALEHEISTLRQSLRRGETLVLPGLIQRLLPESPTKGQRRKIMEWRAFVVWGEWTGGEWDAVVYLAGKEQKK